MSNVPAPVPFREPFNVDTLFRFLDKVPFSPIFLAIIPALVNLHSTQYHDASLIPSEPLTLSSWCAPFSTVLKRYKVPLLMMGFILIKTVNRALSRLVHNNGHYRGDKPVWDNEVAVITGGSAGIGKEVALLLAQRTKKVAVLDLAPLEYEHPHVTYYKCNVGLESEVNAVADKIRAELGNPTILVNNAGIAFGRNILDTSPDALNKIMAVNTYANYNTVRAFLPYMIKKNHGHVVTVASSASYMALPQLSSYAVSKAGALAFHEVLKHELRCRYFAPKVRTTICCPTKVDTILGQNMADHPSKFFTPVLRPQTVARRIVRAIDRGLSEHIMLPGYTEILPAMRGVPSWIKRLIEISGDTDNSVTDESENIAQRNGYKYLPEKEVK